VVYFPVDDSVLQIVTKDGGEMKEKSKVFVLAKHERYMAYILHLSGKYINRNADS
jgi:hypothetical protein